MRKLAACPAEESFIYYRTYVILSLRQQFKRVKKEENMNYYREQEIEDKQISLRLTDWISGDALRDN
jgi:hypothetical protein